MMCITKSPPFVRTFNTCSNVLNVFKKACTAARLLPSSMTPSCEENECSFCLSLVLVLGVILVLMLGVAVVFERGGAIVLMHKSINSSSK